jgi:Subtilase family
MRRVVLGVVVAVSACLSLPASGLAAFPWRPASPGAAPNDLTGSLEWKFAATPEEGNLLVNGRASELGGVRGMSLVDKASPETAFRTTTGRPDVTIAVLDSGIKWNDRGAMVDLRHKVRLNTRELPEPRRDRSGPALEAGVDCASYRAGYDANGDGVVNVSDWACDPRVQRDPAGRGGTGVGPADLLDPQDLLIAFSDGKDADRNGFTDDIAGWDFLDDDNDPFDDVQYGHGTGEALDSNAEADNGGDLGACPNCTVLPLRVGDSFVADVNDFAQAALYAVDSGALVIQEALGTLNNSTLARQAVDYAYERGVAVIASAADEAAQHHNWPSSLPRTIVVNSIRKYDDTLTPQPRSYLQVNGCTNFSTKITLAIPSTSCSSEATGRSAGVAGLVYSAALDARDAGRLASHPTCRRATGGRCVLSADEVRQLMGTGSIDGTGQADDVDFATKPETSCTQRRVPSCTDPNRNAPNTEAVVSILSATKRYPARKGPDQFYGYGRLNARRAVAAAGAGSVPPEVEITAPEWFAQLDPGAARATVRGDVAGRGGSYTCQAYVAPGASPNDDPTTASPPGDFAKVGGGWCDGSRRAGAYAGTLAVVDLKALERRFPASAGDFRGRESGTGGQTSNGRPDVDAYAFTVKVVVTAGKRTGSDRRQAYLHRDRDLMPGWPRSLGRTDGAASPALADLDGDNRAELIVATSDGVVHAYEPNGREARGWPVRGDRLPLHRGGRAFRTGGANAGAAGAFLASPAVGDLDRDGVPEVVAADYEGRIYVWSATGRRLRTLRANPRFSGKPLKPFVDVRKGPRNRTNHGFLASPVLADLDGDDGGRLEIVAAAMDRNVYAFNDDGSAVKGFPVLVVDPAKVASVDRTTRAVRFKAGTGPELNQGAIVDTPAVGDIAGDGRPEIVVGTNEEYAAGAGGEPPLNAGGPNTASLAALSATGALSFGNSRLYAIKPTGTASGRSAFLPGWPVRIGLVNTELLPVVGEGITGSPVIGPIDCPSGGKGRKVGVIPGAGVGYILNPNGASCYGKADGKDVALATDVPAGKGKYDTPTFATVGHPALGRLGGSISFVAPATGLIRALDLSLNEYQGGQDFMGAWNASSGAVRPGFPSPTNDLQFLTGPSVGDVGGSAGEEVVGGTSSLDLHAFSANGREASSAWPKLTADWTAANPLLGAFGTLETGKGARKSVIGVTRAGTVFVWRTTAPACSPSSWPRFHHDLANSGDFDRDAVAPGAPTGLELRGAKLSFVAPGDDLLCGRAARYEVAASSRPVTARSFGKGSGGSDRPGVAAGARVTLTVPAKGRYVGVRALDEAGNPGRISMLVKSE